MPNTILQSKEHFNPAFEAEYYKLYPEILKRIQDNIRAKQQKPPNNLTDQPSQTNQSNIASPTIEQNDQPFGLLSINPNPNLHPVGR